MPGTPSMVRKTVSPTELGRLPSMCMVSSVLVAQPWAFIEPVQVLPDAGGERGDRRPVQQFLGEPGGYRRALVVGRPGLRVPDLDRPDQAADGVGDLANRDRGAAFQRERLVGGGRRQGAHVRVGEVLDVDVVALLL